jgi:hypothetical protein
MEWGDGCNTNWVAFKATRFGQMRIRPSRLQTAVACKSLDQETGKWIEYYEDEDILLWPDDAVAYEMREGELWLYTSRDKANALVLRESRTP